MGSIKILDTGFIKPDNSGTRASSNNMANSGSPITLKVARFTPQLSRNMDDNPELGANNFSEVNLGSLENMKFTLRCVLNSNNDSDMQILSELINLVITNNYKIMWYDYTNSSLEKNNGVVIYQIAKNPKIGHQFTDGEKAFWSLSDNFYHIHVHFKSIQFIQEGAKGFVEYELTGILLKVPTTTNTPS